MRSSIKTDMIVRWKVRLPILLALYDLALFCGALLFHHRSRVPPLFFILGQIPVLLPSYLLIPRTASLIQLMTGFYPGNATQKFIFWIVPLIIWVTYGFIAGTLFDRHFARLRQSGGSGTMILCKVCGAKQQMDRDTKYCDQCGKSLETRKV